MELKPDMYVRTKDGDMFVLDKIEDNHLIPKYVHIPYIITEEDVIKTSYNIIDLIEVGDYVNGYLVIEKPYTYHDIQFVSVNTQDSWSWGKGEMPIENIKSIVTKEMFESMSYKVGE